MAYVLLLQQQGQGFVSVFGLFKDAECASKYSRHITVPDYICSVDKATEEEITKALEIYTSKSNAFYTTEFLGVRTMK
uniref:Uncharacterized protein n=1 Tax=viral metagenome TaxID=1070528 RepID=A0A6C0JR77_9ZZZZ